MTRYPFAALIIGCILDVAGAQELPSANITPVVLSGQRTQVWRTFNLNPDCGPAGVIVGKLTKKAKGQVDFEENLGFSTYAKNSLQYECNTRQTDGLSIFYTSPTEFKGTDSFEIEIVNGRGQSRKVSFRVTVKEAEQVCVKYHKCVPLDQFKCETITQSSFINRVCYVEAKKYMIIKLDETYYHYCNIGPQTVSSLLAAPSMGRYYNTEIRGRGDLHGPFDCRDHPIPSL